MVHSGLAVLVFKTAAAHALLVAVEEDGLAVRVAVMTRVVLGVQAMLTAAAESLYRTNRVSVQAMD